MCVFFVVVVVVVVVFFLKNIGEFLAEILEFFSVLIKIFAFEQSRAIIPGVDDHNQIGHFRVLVCKAFYIKMSSACSFIVMHEWFRT